MAVSRSDVRSRVSAAISQALTDAGWRESRYVIDLIGADPRSAAHLSYAVGLGSTAPAANDDRQIRTAGAWTRTQVLVRWVHAIDPKRQVESYDAALDAGEQLVAAVLGMSPAESNPQLHVDLVRYAGQSLAGDGTYLLSDVEFVARHWLALQ